MLTVNRIGYSLPIYSNIQDKRSGARRENMPALKTLESDTVSFSGIFGTKKPPVPKYVSQEVYDTVCNFLKDESNKPAWDFMKYIKTMCESSANIAHLDAYAHAEILFNKSLGKEKTEEISQILMKIKNCKETDKRPVLREFMDDYNEILCRNSLK